MILYIGESLMKIHNNIEIHLTGTYLTNMPRDPIVGGAAKHLCVLIGVTDNDKTGGNSLAAECMLSF